MKYIVLIFLVLLILLAFLKINQESEINIEKFHCYLDSFKIDLTGKVTNIEMLDKGKAKLELFVIRSNVKLHKFQDNRKMKGFNFLEINNDKAFLICAFKKEIPKADSVLISFSKRQINYFQNSKVVANEEL